MRTVHYEEIKSRVRLENVIDPVRESFKSYSAGRANIPPVQHLEMPSCGHSALHIKTGHVEPLPFCLVKIASTFPENARRDPPRPSINGVIVVFSTVDGDPLALLEDRAWITQVRTAAAGAVAADLLGREDAKTLGVIGSGTQAGLQAAAVLQVRPGIERLQVWGRSPPRTAAFVETTRKRHPNLAVEHAASAEAVSRTADVLVTTTYSSEPLVKGEWLPKGVLVIAMGGDSIHKRELDSPAIRDANRVIVDSRSQNEHLAEVGYGIRNGDFGPERIDAEIGEVLLALGPHAGRAGGRRAADEKIICKLTGVAVQEIFVCDLLLKELGLV